ncbi:MAG: DUF4258 domain-containing protein [Patescibacteria group bacterium]
MPVVFSDHAKFQLKERNISQKRMLEVVMNPTETSQSFKNRRLWRKSFGGKILQAVTITEGSKITVISGYYLRKK